MDSVQSLYQHIYHKMARNRGAWFAVLVAYGWIYGTHQVEPHQDLRREQRTLLVRSCGPVPSLR
jgi:hypothetical protein